MLTQRLAYAGIKERKTAVTRKATDNNVKQIQTAIKLQSGTRPMSAEIWASIRHKDFTRQVRNFLWKSVHSAHRIRTFWKHIPEYLEHIILKCRRPGQSEIWKLAKDLWQKKHPTWPVLSLGNILGCGLVSLFMIWKIRNECVISRGGAEMPRHEIHNKWLYAMNMRLKFDRALTNHAKFGKQNSIKVSLVLRTWSST
ncbi:hypothetical protein B0H16DRAFT_1667787 [Mycena metata]|uniref:Uncharacterized protein n=1 Tax=Mycena metata TaxID=1033252 RepID=A0AAD7H3A2_9AGAR|nr:hypothetical protein B0H16DRAFT_1667787 [Mycena metata]